MGLITRVTSLIKADAHGVVDTLEDRALVLKQHLREAEAELLRKKARIETLSMEEKQCREVSKRLGTEAKRLEDDVALALDGDKDELARFAVKRLLGVSRRIEQLDRRTKELREAKEDLAAQVEQQEQDFSELRVRAKAYFDRAHAAEEGEFAERIIEDEEVELELLRRRERRSERTES